MDEENYFGKLIKYIKNVYKIDDEFRSLTDDRINPTYQTGHEVSLALFGFLLSLAEVFSAERIILITHLVSLWIVASIAPFELL